MSVVGAFTIASGNYLAYARVVARSYLEHHPEHRFFLILADRDVVAAESEDEPFELVSVDDIPIPNFEFFAVQYNILEFNTALKSYAFEYLFANHDLDSLVYLDPDIRIYSRLNEAWKALESCDAVVTPHVRKAFHDRQHPSEQDLLIAGTYNLGFIGLRRSEPVREFLAWWSERLYMDCRVDLQNGLFVDQKWIDLMPGLLSDVEVLRHPGYNAAYWNLHERRLSNVSGQITADSLPLRFFHFSGFDPLRPDLLSRHQHRHLPSDSEVLESLCSSYAAELEDDGYTQTIQHAWAFGKLGNGIPVVQCIRKAVRQCMVSRLKVPPPLSDSDSFCRFIATPLVGMSEHPLSPVVSAVLDCRPDLLASFPGCGRNPDDSGLLNWLGLNGHEVGLSEFIAKFGSHFSGMDGASGLLKLFSNREDLRRAFPNAFASPSGFANFRVEWVERFGKAEASLTERAVDSCVVVFPAFLRVLDLYFSLSELNSAVPVIYSDESIDRIAELTMAKSNSISGLTPDGIALFIEVAKARKFDLLKLSLVLSPAAARVLGGRPSVFHLDSLRMLLSSVGALARWSEILDWLLLGEDVALDEQVQMALDANQWLRSRWMESPQAVRSRLLFSELVSTAESDIRSRPGWRVVPGRVKEMSESSNRKGINLLGYFGAPTGMGQAARSLLATLNLTDIEHRAVRIPCQFDVADRNFGIDLFGRYNRPDTGLETNIVVVNADAVANEKHWSCDLGRSSKEQIGYWLWETERLPRRFSSSQRGLSSVWTSSNYSAEAIRATVDLPVHVVPLGMDFDELNAIWADRSRFGLPEDKLLFGFFFDTKSSTHRKNPAGLLRAFREVYGSRTDVGLVLKVNSPAFGEFEYERLKHMAVGLNVFWIEKELDRRSTLSLMKSLDAYVSLHRSEGFGLTIAEAMGLSVPVAATGYGGNVDFMSAESSLLVDFQVVETDRAHGPYNAGTRWADPDFDSACKALATMADTEIRSRLGSAGHQHIRGMLDPERLKKDFLHALGSSITSCVAG